MLLRTMALEDTSVRVLAYAPGPLDTDMQSAIRIFSADDEVRRQFAGVYHMAVTLINCSNAALLI